MVSIGYFKSGHCSRPVKFFPKKLCTFLLQKSAYIICKNWSNYRRVIFLHFL
jgi:hypothetical protein